MLITKLTENNLDIFIQFEGDGGADGGGVVWSHFFGGGAFGLPLFSFNVRDLHSYLLPLSVRGGQRQQLLRNKSLNRTRTERILYNDSDVIFFNPSSSDQTHQSSEQTHYL